MKRTFRSNTKHSSETFSSKRSQPYMPDRALEFSPALFSPTFGREPLDYGVFPTYDYPDLHISVTPAAGQPDMAWPSMQMNQFDGFSFSEVDQVAQMARACKLPISPDFAAFAAQPLSHAQPASSGPQRLRSATHNFPYVDAVQRIDNTGQTQALASVHDSGHDLQILSGETVQSLNCEGAEISKEDRAETPTGLGCQLHSHQRIALTWMQRQEKSHMKGGFLADDMGLGKTISVLALLVATRNADNPQTTLIVAPLTLISQWHSQITDMAPSLTVFRCHKPPREVSAKELMSFDVVLTTYETVVRDWKRRPQIEGNECRLFHPHHSLFHRVVLDESHEIKNRRTKAFRAVCDIRSLHHWCLSGTPMMNGVDELLAQFKFLQIKQDDPKLVSKISGALNGKKIAPQVIQDLRKLLQRTMLRRTKSSMVDGKPVVHLPRKTENIVWVDLKPFERNDYDVLTAKLDSACDSESKAMSMRGGSHFKELIRLRQQCCHPGLSSISEDNTAASLKVSEYRRPPLGDSAPDDERSGLDTHSGALTELVQVQQPSPEPSELGSAKIEKCIEIIRDIEKTGEKIIVFSQWIKLLGALKRAIGGAMPQMKYCLLTGEMSTTERQSAVSDFMINPKVTVMMISLFAGSVGLNLTAASHVIIMEPFWNPYVEMQAVDRAHRMGQKKPVMVYRILARNTIEDRVIQMQKDKREVIDAIFGEGSVADVTEPLRRTSAS